MYRYTDMFGNRKTLYSYRLVASDKLPEGRKYCRSLRELEDDVKYDVVDGIKDGKAAFNDVFSMLMTVKREYRMSTARRYRDTWNCYISENIGLKPIASIRYSDLKRLYSHLIYDRGLTLNTVRSVHTVISITMRFAVRERFIRSDPNDGVLNEFAKTDLTPTTKRLALTIDQQNRFMEVIHTIGRFNKWISLFTFLLGTGCRIGEALAIRWDDVDFDRGLIFIKRSTAYERVDGKFGCHIFPPKTRNGIRTIPLLREVREALLDEYKLQKALRIKSLMIDGLDGFIFFTRTGNLHNESKINATMKRIIEAANESPYDEHLPSFGPHTLRHTFCTRMCEMGVNAKVLQSIMGHSSITTTLDIYTNVTDESMKNELKKVGCERISSYTNFTPIEHQFQPKLWEDIRTYDRKFLVNKGI